MLIGVVILLSELPQFVLPAPVGSYVALQNILFPTLFDAKGGVKSFAGRRFSDVEWLMLLDQFRNAGFVFPPKHCQALNFLLLNWGMHMLRSFRPTIDVQSAPEQASDNEKADATKDDETSEFEKEGATNDDENSELDENAKEVDMSCAKAWR